MLNLKILKPIPVCLHSYFMLLFFMGLIVTHGCTQDASVGVMAGSEATNGPQGSDPDSFAPLPSPPDSGLTVFPDANTPQNRDQGMEATPQDAEVASPELVASPPDEPDFTPPIVDECADAGDPCDVCTCRLCAQELEECLADPRCEAVLLCAQRTGCSGIDCLDVCSDEIDNAGGVFGGAVQNAQAVGDCRDDECGNTDADCLDADPGPPAPTPLDMGVDPPSTLDQGLPTPPDPGGCEQFDYEELCSTGQTALGEQYCEVFALTRSTCTEWCAEQGGRCIDGWDDVSSSCERDENHGCDDRERDQICRCEIP